jgi:vacuolar-type H+-ATPase subunit I/STV1
MAIAKINKIEIIGLQKDKEELLALLQKLGILELIAVKSQDTDIVPKVVDSGIDLLAIEEAISFLASFKEKAAGFLDSIVTFKPPVYQQQLQEVIATFNYQNILTDLSGLRNQLKNIFLHKDRLIQEKQLLSPWRRLHISLDELHYQQHCGIILGILNTRDYLRLLEDTEKNKFNLYLDIVHQDKANTYLIIFYLREEFEQLGTLLCYFNPA